MHDAAEALVREVERDFERSSETIGRRRMHTAVEQAMRSVPREAFVPNELRGSAYENRPLPIGQGQTISQPFIVALMTDCLEPHVDMRVLEIGTGCGYQAAVLAETVGEVYSIEAIDNLADSARKRLHALGYDNVHVRVGNGRKGWPEAAPFDGILVTAAGEDVPSALLAQLAPGGRMVIPVHAARGAQELRVITKDAGGGTSSRAILPVAFVPLVDD